ncbi:MAG TPA: M55 family metallopeptidase [Terriglobia bacterium]|nr:M55 family metallopeptidase [Terriglobia bacterium]
MIRTASQLAVKALILAVSLIAATAQAPKKVFVISDLEGVDGIFDFDLQCIPYQSPRYRESQKFLTDEVNAAVEGLREGGATEVVVYDGHAGGRNLSTLDIQPQVRLLVGGPISPTLELDASYSAVIFIGLHAMAGTAKAILPHSYTWDIQNIWVNGKGTGEIGGRTMLAGYFGVPVIMLSGDRAACDEFHDLVPNGECAEVKSGVSGSAGLMLPHAAACALIGQQARSAIERVAGFKPYRVSGPVEVKVEFTTSASRTFARRDGVEQLDARTWAFRGENILDAWLKYSSF